MSIYDANGNAISVGYAEDGSQLNYAYDVSGDTVFQSGDPMDDYIAGRVLTFEDDFNGTALDTTKWIYELGDVGRNNESQTYRSQNVAVENGCLVLTAKRESYNNKNWTSGSITTQGKFEQTYGRWEAKIKFPNVNGAFCAFWGKGANQVNIYHEDGKRETGGVQWPMCGEFDITETIPGTSTKARSNLWKYSGGSLGSGASTNLVSSDWHVYGMEWTDAYIQMFVDGVAFKKYTFSNYNATEIQAYYLPFFMIINMAVGSSGGTPASTLNEMKMYVDWVRVYAPLNVT